MFVSVNSQPPAVTRLEVMIADQDEFAPTFEQSEYTVEVPEDIQAGSFVHQLVLTDPDASGLQNERWTFRLDSLTDPIRDWIRRLCTERQPRNHTLVLRLMFYQSVL